MKVKQIFVAPIVLLRSSVGPASTWEAWVRIPSKSECFRLLCVFAKITVHLRGSFLYLNIFQFVGSWWVFFLSNVKVALNEKKFTYASKLLSVHSKAIYSIHRFNETFYFVRALLIMHKTHLCSNELLYVIINPGSQKESFEIYTCYYSHYSLLECEKRKLKP